MKTKYEIAEDLFFKGDYLQSFDLFKNVSGNDTSSVHEKSDALNMMGSIVLIDTRVENSDESGLEYFIKSLEFNPKNIGALLNIVEGFGLAINNHRNVTMLDYALKVLKETNYILTEKDNVMIAQKNKLKEELIQAREKQDK